MPVDLEAATHKDASTFTNPHRRHEYKHPSPFQRICPGLVFEFKPLGVGSRPCHYGAGTRSFHGARHGLRLQICQTSRGNCLGLWDYHWIGWRLNHVGRSLIDAAFASVIRVAYD